MASSNIRMSARNKDLRKFEGNGWRVTVSTHSEHEIASVLGVAADAAPEERPSQADSKPAPEKPRDWAETILERSLRWAPLDFSAPLWLLKATEQSEYALFQLPSPDNRWIVKFAGKISGPYNYRMAGWGDLHELITHGHLLENSDCPVVQEKIGDAVTADVFNEQVRGRIDRVRRLIARSDLQAACALREAVRVVDGRWTFCFPVKWLTALGEVPYDAEMVLRGKNWEVTFPDVGDTLTVADGAATRSIARLLTCNNIACPSALLVDGELLTA